MSASLPALVGETFDLTAEEKAGWAECVAAGLDEELARSVLSHTHIVMMIRGFWDEKDRVGETVRRVNQIAAFKQKHRLQERTSLPDAAVDYFHANWATRAYGADAHGHVVFCERLEWYDVPRLMGRFTEDEQWLATRGVLCEAMERIKGNAGEGKNDSLNPIYKHIHILDLSGITMSHASADVRNVIKKVVIEMGNYYPDSMYKLFFVNAPFVFRAVWGLISPFVHPATKEKISICGGGSALLSELSRHNIAASAVPDFLGGGHKGVALMDKLDEWREERRKNETEAAAK